MKEIGGFFGLELSHFNKEYHTGALRLNKARSALNYLILQKNVKKIYIPYYMCSCILEPILDLGIEHEYYRLDEDMLPNFSKEVYDNELFLYINYFGLCDQNVTTVVNKLNNVVVDNTQSFYSRPLNGCDTIYSPRKFFGVPDGGYLYSTDSYMIELEPSSSYQQFEFLLKRIDYSAQEAYSQFQEQERWLTGQGMKQMSRLTETMLKSIDYDGVRDIRLRNFDFLHENLSKINELKIERSRDSVPMVYPLLIENNSIKEQLISEKVYIPTYWKEVIEISEYDWFERRLVDNLVCLPIDQRWGLADMEQILSVLKRILA
ncbi:hypothetical protein [Paenibacillus sp. J22TS3]|uniref:hypothetical protein n=1 Tax=Paenibacillus sp. J22TS3 TaxID=2807192 RepID=UPI001B18DA98|nr:hypothetical protein [Paenibacillus sp. J22TS3]GIP21750.1 hypothetical protein J22TS3_20250 [Paenibacillus sp. J22TS3]